MTSKLLGYNDISDSRLLAVCSKYIYIPLSINSDKDITLLVKKGDYVLKGMVIGKTKGKYKTYIYSSVSGIVTNFVEKETFFNQKIKCIEIENDYKENKLIDKDTCNDIGKYSKNEFLEILKNITYTENEIPLVCKYEDVFPKVMLVNVLDYRRYIYNAVFILKKYLSEILETIDAIMQANKMKESYLIIPKKNKEIKKLLNRFIGTYPEIKIIEINKLPRKNFEKKLIKRIKHKNYPQEKEIIYHNLDTIYKLYTGLKFNKFQTNKIITTIINNSKIEMKTVKIGTILGDVINEENLSTEIYLISKNKIKKVNDVFNFVITDDIDGIII